ALIIQLKCCCRIARYIFGFVDGSKIPVRVPHLQNGTSIVWHLLETCCNDNQLIECTDVIAITIPAPAVTICSVHGLSIVAILHHLFRVTSDRLNVVSSSEHPESFIQMEERISVSSLPEHDPFDRAFVDCGHRTGRDENISISGATMNSFLS